MKRQRNRLIVGLDLDGVILDHTRAKITLAKKFGFSLQPEETPSELIKNILPHHTVRTMQHFLYNEPATTLRAEIFRGARAGLSQLKKAGVPLFLISRRENPELAIALLKKRSLWPSYFNAKNTSFVAEKEDKNKKAREFGITIYLDDQPSVLEKLADVPTRILMDRFGVFNEYDGQYKRGASWKEFLEQLGF